MKKIIFAIVFALMGISASAQKGDIAAGLNLSYGTEINFMGIGAKGQYGITDAIRTEASFDYFLKKDGLSMWDVNLNVHYLFPLTEKLKVYPLAGFTFTNWTMTWGEEEYYWDDFSESYFGLNLGAGLQYDLTDKLALNVEAKYQLVNLFDQLVLGVGVSYKF